MASLLERRIPFRVSLIYGLPEQTVGSFQATIEWCRSRGIERISAFPLMLLRGTALERERGRWSLVENDAPIPVVVESSTFTRDDWLRMKAIAEALPGL